MIKLHQRVLLIAALLVIPGIVRAGETDLTVYMEMSGHYDAIRLGLLADSTEGLAEHATALQQKAGSLLETFSAAKAGVPEAEASDTEATLQEIEAKAASLAATDDLVAAREDFFALTKPMARYRKLTSDDSTVVAYCSMAQKAWIQPEGDIGNPYLGQEMPTCGEVISN
jgi:hypothetical protein